MELLLLPLLILLNGVFALSEIAVLSAREARLRALADQGRPGAGSALGLKRNPTVFLSTIQIGITMVGILSGAIGETALVVPFSRWLATFPVLAPHAELLALAGVVATLTYVSVVVGELVPKHLGLLQPERAAALIARPMLLLARFGRPLVWFLSASSYLLLRLIGARRRPETGVSDEEIRLLMAQGAEAGVFHRSEQVLVSNVLRLDEQPVVAIMTHRTDIATLDLNRPEKEIRETLGSCPYSRIIACRGGLEDVAGLLRTADLLPTVLAGAPLDITRHLRPPLYLPEYVTTTQLLENFRKAQLQCALIVDEYGDIQGFVTLTDVLTAIVGEVPTSRGNDDLGIVRREDGSWLVGGGVPIERVRLLLALRRELPGERARAYYTLGGFVIHVLGRIPQETDHFEEQGFRFEVVDMDGSRIDKVLISPVAPATDPATTQ